MRPTWVSYITVRGAPGFRHSASNRKGSRFVPFLLQTGVLVDNPFLTVLGRRGRGAVVEALRRAPNRTWSVRDLARFADVEPMTAARAVRELAALGAVDSARPGRDARVRWVAHAPAAQWLASLQVPDLRLEAARAFATAYGRPPGLLRILLWRSPGEDPASPGTPPRLALVGAAPEALLDAAGPALDAVLAAGLPAPVLAAFGRSELDPRDPVAAAVLAGVAI